VGAGAALAALGESPLSRKFTVTVITMGTGTPLRSVGL
jgi:hypothetical protein